MGDAGLRAAVLFLLVLLLLHLGVSRTTDDGEPPGGSNTYSLHFKNKQRYVVRRDAGSPYKSFFLYVEEVQKTSVVYPLRYVNDPPIKYFEQIVPYTRREIKGKNLKNFCEENKKLYQHVNNREICFCCHCSPHPVFPLYSHLKYKRQKIFCRRRVTDGEEAVILTLKCLRRSKRKYHSFFVQRSLNSFMVKVTLQEFNLNDEFFLSRNDKSALESRTYLLDPSNTEIDDEVFNVRLKFLPERTHRGGSIEGNYLFIDSDVFKRRVVLDDSFTDEEVLENGLIVSADHVDEKGMECNKVMAYPNVWEEKKGFCQHGRNHCLKGQLTEFIKLEGRLEVKKKVRYNYSFIMARKDRLGGAAIGGSGNGDANRAMHGNPAPPPRELQEDYYMGLQKRSHNFAQMTSHAGEGLNITYEEDVHGESVSLVHMLRNCYDFNNEVDPFCSVYISIWNAEDVEKEVTVSINCSKKMVVDETTLRRTLVLLKKEDSSVVIKFKPIADLLVTPCRVVVQRQQGPPQPQQQKGNIRGESHKGGHRGSGEEGQEDLATEQYFKFFLRSSEEKEETPGRIIWNSPLHFHHVSGDIIQLHKKRLELLEQEDEGADGGGGRATIPFSGYSISVKVFFLLLSIILVLTFVVPSVHPLNGFLLKRKWFYTLRKVRMFFIWLIQDACRFVHVIVKRTFKGVKCVLVKVYRAVFRGRRKRRKKEQQIIGDSYLHKQMRRRKKDERRRKKKLKGDKLIREQEEMRRRRHKRLMLHEEQCKGGRHHSRRGQSKGGDSSSAPSPCCERSERSESSASGDRSEHVRRPKRDGARGKKNHRTRNSSKRGEGGKTNRVVASPH
ncbi:hypothetical protein AK88_01225 [Plasmodium fragile]|uniref:Generative cell specific-1/HAP2 domain-containing protein n=1 Tax=Plasmodium fragile TaxID=5857 RepID=A0A0D9QQ18_PLAFR|nr:uncharacterized protein AK88_01225 [Plasmodium fragile]KJP89139.1 hypothetical protein AK88_01225 [Plasmodium fragile]